jgi:hypothetical protein
MRTVEFVRRCSSQYWLHVSKALGHIIAAVIWMPQLGSAVMAYYYCLKLYRRQVYTVDGMEKG